MKSTDFCKAMSQELSNWQTRLHYVTNKFDSMPSIDKYKLTSHIEGLHILLTEIEDRIHSLETECPTNWSDEGDEIKVKMGEFAGRFKETEGVLHDYDFGG